MQRTCLLLYFCLLLVSCKKTPWPTKSIASQETVQPAKERAVPSRPSSLQSLIHAYRDECHQIGGTLTGEQTTPEVQTVNLDNDDKPDYLLNPKNLQCNESASLYCPNAGCEIRIAVSNNDYRNPLTVLGGEATLVDEPSGNAIEIEVQSFHCKGASRQDTCIDTVAWRQNKFTESLSVKH